MKFIIFLLYVRSIMSERIIAVFWVFITFTLMVLMLVVLGCGPEPEPDVPEPPEMPEFEDEPEYKFWSPWETVEANIITGPSYIYDEDPQDFEVQFRVETSRQVRIYAGFWCPGDLEQSGSGVFLLGPFVEKVCISVETDLISEEGQWFLKLERRQR